MFSVAGMTRNSDIGPLGRAYSLLGVSRVKPASFQTLFPHFPPRSLVMCFHSHLYVLKIFCGIFCADKLVSMFCSVVVSCGSVGGYVAFFPTTLPVLNLVYFCLRITLEHYV